MTTTPQHTFGPDLPDRSTDPTVAFQPNGSEFPEDISSDPTPTTAAEDGLDAAELTRGAWLRLLGAVAAGVAVATVVLLSTTSTVVWWGGYLVCASLGWDALRRFRAAGALTGKGIDARVWVATGLGLALVVGAGVAAAVHWTTPIETTSQSVVGTCWQDAGDSMNLVDCDDPGAAYEATSTQSDDDDCPAQVTDYRITLDDGTVACLESK